MMIDASIEPCVLAAVPLLVSVGLGNIAERPLEQGMLERSVVVGTQLVGAMERAISV